MTCGHGYDNEIRLLHSTAASAPIDSAAGLDNNTGCAWKRRERKWTIHHAVLSSRMDDERARKARLILEHPPTSPDHFPTPLSGLVDPPSPMASSAKLRDFRDRCAIPMMRSRPDDPNWPAFLQQVDIVLAWRETIPPEDRFWKPD